MSFWGYHLMLDCAGCRHDDISNAGTINSFAKHLVKAIDMVAYGEPQIVHFGEGNKQGFTLVQLIETSNICAHFVEEDNTMYLDVFSCKDYNYEVVVDLVRQYFGPTSIRPSFITRQA